MEDTKDLEEINKNILEQVSDIKTILICLAIFVVIQLLLYGGYLFYLLQGPR